MCNLSFNFMSFLGNNQSLFIGQVEIMTGLSN